MKSAKDIHPRTDGFSYRDWQTGWAFPVVRAYAWRHTSTEAIRHAFIRGADWGYRSVSMCGVMSTAWYGPSLNLGRYIQMPRCTDCLRLIGAPDPAEHLYQWTVPPPRVRKRHAPKEQGHTPFNGQPKRDPLSAEDKAAIRAEEQYRGVGADLARRYGVSESTIYYIRNGSRPS